jgi:hypothetical protein
MTLATLTPEETIYNPANAKPAPSNASASHSSLIPPVSTSARPLPCYCRKYSRGATPNPRPWPCPTAAHAQCPKYGVHGSMSSKCAFNVQYCKCHIPILYIDVCQIPAP